jgi:hypothetical protein
LLKALFQYAREKREDGVYDFTEIVETSGKDDQGVGGNRP